MFDRIVRSGTIGFFPCSEFTRERTIVTNISGDRFQVPAQCRIVDPRCLAPDSPAETPRPYLAALAWGRP